MNKLRSISLVGLIGLALGVGPFAAPGWNSAGADDLPGRVRVSSRDSDVPPNKTPRPAPARSTKPASKAGKIVPVRREEYDEPPGKPDEAVKPDEPSGAPAAGDDDVDPLETMMTAEVTPIDLLGALRLAGAQNPLILLGQERVVEAVALRQLACAQFLPTLNLGISTDAHWGVLQQSTGNILEVQRENVFIGAGANTIAAGTVNIPGLLLNYNVSDAIFTFLVSRQEVDRREFASRTVRQDVLLDVSLAYNNLVRSEGARSVAIVSRDDARELALITDAYWKTGQGRKADADRAATELARREARLYEAQGNVVRASAALCQTLHLDPSIRLHAADVQVIPRSIVPDPIPLPELLALALLNRPELNERRSAVTQALLALKGAKMLPFSPTVFLGFSAGGMGGGSNLVNAPATDLPFGKGEPRFAPLQDRQDLDVMAYWTLQNLGVGNKAMIAAARSRLSSSDFQMLIVLDRVRSEVAGAQARTHARFARIETCERSITAAMQAFKEDIERVKGAEGLPLEAIDSLRLLAESRLEYLNVILDYNQAQFQLYVSLGKPPAELLMRPADPIQDQQAPPRRAP